ncbi:unnamed protein product, partial [Symbiodinium sp. CCMP2592]
VAQTAVQAAAKRRAALKAAASVGLCNDPGSDSGASTSTAASRTPAKPKAKQLHEGKDIGPAATPQAAVTKRTRAKTTPLPSAEKTPSTSTPLPKSLKQLEGSPGHATPMKTGAGAQVGETPEKKTLEFE